MSITEFFAKNPLWMVYPVIINIIAFLAFGSDKRKAVKGSYRIKEATLLSLAVVGGAVGAIVGMYTFRHKTKKCISDSVCR